MASRRRKSSVHTTGSAGTETATERVREKEREEAEQRERVCVCECQKEFARVSETVRVCE